MKSFFTIFLLTLTSVLYSQNFPQYLSPKPGAKMVSRETNIIINSGSEINAGSLSANSLIITGSKSGKTGASISLSDDRQTIIAQPIRKFTEGETVTVTYMGGIITAAETPVAPFTYSFAVTTLKERIILTGDQKKLFADEYQTLQTPAAAVKNTFANSVADSLPADLPGIQVNVNNNPAPGYIFMSVSTDLTGVGFYNYILDKSGNYVKYMKSNEHYTTNFFTQPNGLITYNQPHDTYPYAGGGHSTVMVLDTNLAVTDSLQCGNGYLSDSHSFQMLPNGHVIMVAYDLQPVDMSQLVTGGNPGALVYGSIVQELDLQRRVIFQWRSWDAIPITDTYQNMKLVGFDYIHVNAIQVDYDGNILVMCRLTSDIIKLNRKTGDVMWRLGGKKNQFTFLNDHPENAPTYFTHPHGLSLLPNGNYLFLDNGLLHTPQHSRAVEYKIDEVNKTATLVWEFRHTPDIYAATQGSAQRLDNGNTLIGWGSASLTGLPAVTEVTPDKQTAFELTVLQNVVSFRVMKSPFRDFKAKAEISKQDLQTGVQYTFDDANIRTGVGVYFQQMISGYNYLNVKRYDTAPKNLQFPGAVPNVLPFRVTMMQLGIASFTADITFDSLFTSTPAEASSITVWRRSTENQGVFSPVATTYNPVTKKLSITTNGTGEFIFGIAQPLSVPLSPIPFAPKSDEPVNQTLPVMFGYSSRGITTGFHLMIATDSLFTSGVVNDSTLASGIYKLQSPAANTRYFWKVRGRNELGWSDWSAVKSFITTAPFLVVKKPDGGEIWKKKTANFITWSNNLPGQVNVQLLRNDTLYAKIASGAENCGSYQWTIPDSLAADTTYIIKVISVTDPAQFDISNNYFSITVVTGAEDVIETPNSISLSQNYPNPFNPSTRIEYTLPSSAYIRLDVYSVTGQLIKTLVNKHQEAGYHSADFAADDLSSGLYIYRLSAGDRVLSRKMLYLK